MKFANFYPYILLMMAIGLFACSEGTETEDLNIDFGYDYYPLEVGKYLIYEVDSITYNIEGSGVEILNSKTFVREEIIDISIDNEGDTIYIIERYERSTPSDDWTIKDVWNTKKDDNRIERTEENIKLIPMVFPLREGVDFDATLFVDEDTEVIIAGESIKAFKNWNAEVQTVGLQDTVAGTTYPDVATIHHADDENLIEKRFSSSKYARNIGLIFKEEWILDTQNLTESEPWETKAEKGYILSQKLIEYN